MPPRYKIRFPDSASYDAALATENTGTLHLAVTNRQRRLISLGVPAVLSGEARVQHELDAWLNRFEAGYHAVVSVDFRYELDFGPDMEVELGVELAGGPSLDDVLDVIRARDVWGQSIGENVAIAVVDTGINGQRPEFPVEQRVGQWQPHGQTPWTDEHGHGTMCACIAAGSRRAGGAFDGVAPGAGLIACKTGFFDSELASIYDYLSELVEQAGFTIVATNSFGTRAGSAPPPPPDSDFIPALTNAIARGVKVFFSAGNYHLLAGGQPTHCNPTSIWLHKCREDVLTIANCQLDGAIWEDSSRGPGQHHGESGASVKPDVAAPTPLNGRVVYLDAVQTVSRWGTSGACPQAAGLAALLLAQRPELTYQQLFGIIRGTATTLPQAALHCVGQGLINCQAAFDAL